MREKLCRRVIYLSFGDVTGWINRLSERMSVRTRIGVVNEQPQWPVVFV